MTIVTKVTKVSYVANVSKNSSPWGDVRSFPMWFEHPTQKASYCSKLANRAKTPKNSVFEGNLTLNDLLIL